MREVENPAKITKVSDLKITLRAVSCGQRATRFGGLAFPAYGSNSLLGGYQGMGNRMHREGDAILHSHFAHQLRHVRLDRALFDAKL